MWSQMYDSIRDSHECPEDEVIMDDDLLDGWFVKQRKDRKQRQAKQEIDQRLNNKDISGKQEVYVMARGDQDAQNIHDVNDAAGKMIIRQRMHVLHRKGSAVDLDFKDRKADLAGAAHQQMRNHIRRR